MADKRIYRVDEQTSDEVQTSYLVRASTPAQAVRHLAQRFRCEVATQDDVFELAAAGVKVQDAGE